MIEAYSIEISNRQSSFPIDQHGFRKAVALVLSESDFLSAEISLSFVGDQEMHRLNVEFLGHDYPTDVLSFPLAKESRSLVGEIIVSVDTAARECNSHGLNAIEELMLYVVHGILHLVGYDDKSEESRSVMRAKEEYYMEKLGVEL
ncbi:MAG: rRNA maturation RNase YbeY [Planctomycetota bacterium]|nr:rRNA maturation RNase YbeY [Planctomycetota bacterium]